MPADICITVLYIPSQRGTIYVNHAFKHLLFLHLDNANNTHTYTNYNLNHSQLEGIFVFDSIFKMHHTDPKLTCSKHVQTSPLFQILQQCFSVSALNHITLLPLTGTLGHILLTVSQSPAPVRHPGLSQHIPNIYTHSSLSTTTYSQYMQCIQFYTMWISVGINQAPYTYISHKLYWVDLDGSANVIN